MSKLDQHRKWETYSVDTLKAIRRELAYADRFEAVKIVNEIIEKKSKKDQDPNLKMLIFNKIKKRDI